MRTKLEKYGFVHSFGFPLEECQDYLDIIDVIKRAKELIETMDLGGDVRIGKLRQAVAKVSEKSNEDILNRQLEQMGFIENERTLILNFIDVIWKNRKRT